MGALLSDRGSLSLTVFLYLCVYLRMTLTPPAKENHQIRQKEAQSVTDIQDIVPSAPGAQPLWSLHSLLPRRPAGIFSISSR